MRAAIFDKNNVLVGAEEVSDKVALKHRRIDCGDLPVNGSYKYDATLSQFVPLGHGFGKVKVSQPVSNELVIASLIDTMKAAGMTLPHEAELWADWYKTTLRMRDEELARRPR